MSPQRNRTDPRPDAIVALGRMAATAGDDIRETRRRRRWSLRELADRAGVSAGARPRRGPGPCGDGEFEAGHLRRLGLSVSLDEPYQHYQFAGRADLLAWDPARRTLLHVENRTRFPNTQEAFGAYHAKRTYLARVLAERLGGRRASPGVGRT